MSVEIVPAEEMTLADCEQIIEAGIETFVEVGNALLLIRDGKKYREAGYKTFENYCQERWNYTRSHGKRLIESAEVVSILAPIGAKPANEWQARALAPLKDDPKAMAEAWTEAQRRAGEEGRKVTGAIVEKVVAEKTTGNRHAGRKWSTSQGRPDLVVERVVKNLLAIASSVSSLDVDGYVATQEQIEGLDRTIKALRKLRQSLVIEK